jgi:hypothetical protein
MSSFIPIFVVLALVALSGAQALYISGLQGQQFHFDGIPNKDFNMISTPNLQVNSVFKFIEQPSQPCNYTDTACFSHAGTYIAELGITINSMPLITKVRIVSRSHQQGLQLFSIENGQEKEIHMKKRLILTTPDGYHVSLLQTSPNTIVINSLFFKMTVSNSDYFFNIGIAMHDDNLMKHGAKKNTICGGDGTGMDGVAMIGGVLYPAVPIHGVIGQTWKNAVYCAGRLYEGEWDDYQVQGLFDNDFRFNQFVTEKNF